MVETFDPKKFSKSSTIKPIETGSIKKLTRQEKNQYVARNGPAILITSPQTIMRHDSLYGENIAAYKMPASRSVDIDNLDDLEYASWLLKKTFD